MISAIANTELIDEGYTLEEIKAMHLLRCRKIIVAGSRTLQNKDGIDFKSKIFEILDGILENHEDRGFTVVSGCAWGPDSYAITWAQQRKLHFIEMPAQWDKAGKRAGYARNERMSKIDGVGLVAFHDGSSRGTQHMIEQMMNRQKPYIVYSANKKNEIVYSY